MSTVLVLQLIFNFREKDDFLDRFTISSAQVAQLWTAFSTFLQLHQILREHLTEVSGSFFFYQNNYIVNNLYIMKFAVFDLSGKETDLFTNIII